MRIYVASSWRNLLQPAIVLALRGIGHEVYDFRRPSDYGKPAPDGARGFSWAEIDPAWETWTPDQYRKALEHPIARAGYANDIAALRECDAVVLVLPSGRSASWEFGYAMARDKPGVVVQFEKFEPELMYSGAAFVTSMTELFDLFGDPPGDEYGNLPITSAQLRTAISSGVWNEHKVAPTQLRGGR